MLQCPNVLGGELMYSLDEIPSVYISRGAAISAKFANDSKRLCNAKLRAPMFAVL